MAARKPAAGKAGSISAKVAAETRKLRAQVAQGGFDDQASCSVGCGLDAWLVDRSGSPLPIYGRFAGRCGDRLGIAAGPMRYAMRFGVPKRKLRTGVLGNLWSDLSQRVQHASDMAERLDARLITVGILPTLGLGDVSDRLLTPGSPELALQHRLRKLDGATDWQFGLAENDGISFSVGPVLPEAMIASQRINLEVPLASSGSYYNAMVMVAGPILAAGANSPFLLGRNLWAETRVPLIEQLAAPRYRASARKGAAPAPPGLFGSGYLGATALDLFEENRKLFPVLIRKPGQDRSAYAHLAAHSDSILRWIRPRIVTQGRRLACELVFGALPSGPTVSDMVANLALLAGAATGLAKLELEGASAAEAEELLPFAAARDNFYACARDGLDAQLTWFGGSGASACDILLEKLVPLARSGLAASGVDASEIYRDLNTIVQRVQARQNGAQWQRRCRETLGGGTLALGRLAEAYRMRQMQNRPVHTWRA